MKTLTVSKNVDGIETLLGKISFGDSGPPTLSLEEQGPEAAKLKEDWDALVARGKIPMEVREVKEVDGDTVTELNAVLVAPGDERYSDAVWSYLESNYGYLVDLDY